MNVTTRALIIPSISNTAVEGLFWTSLTSFALYGVLLAQAGTYFYSRNENEWLLRMMVLVLVTAQTVSMVFDSLSARFYFITNWGNPTVLECFPLSFIIGLFISIITTFLVQLFFTAKVYQVTQHNLPVTIVIGVASIGAFAGGIGMTLIDYTIKFSPSSLSDKIFSSCYSGLSLLADFIMATVMWRQLKGWQSDVQSTNEVIHTLIVHIVARGILVTSVQVANLVLSVAVPSTLAHAGINLVTGKFYVITMLCMLNNRGRLRDTLNGCKDVLMPVPSKLVFRPPQEVDTRLSLTVISVPSEGTTFDRSTIA